MRKLTTEIFIERAVSIHGNLFDYSKVEYVDSYTNIMLICNKHEEFLQLPQVHLSGGGCSKCAKDKLADLFRKGNEKFIQEAIEVHGDKYSYHLVEYKTNRSKVKIVCKYNHEFEQEPSSHLRGKGCPICAGYYIKDISQFISEANVVHNCKYNYSKAKYITSKTKLIIICDDHEEFEQSPNDHLRGAGCPKCANSGPSEGCMEWLTSLDIPDDPKHREVSIRPPGKKWPFRADGYIAETNTIYEYYGDFYHGNPFVYNNPDEQTGLGGQTFGDRYKKMLEKENFLKEAGYNLITIWESEWKKFKKGNSQ